MRPARTHGTDDWPFISYDPLTYPPRKAARLSLSRRLAAFATRAVCLTGAYTCVALAVLLLSGPQA